jgi:DNA-binding response OmpR family regulator
VQEGEVCVLLADDNPDYLWLLKKLLQLRGYKVLVAQDGINALETATTKEPDILVLDIQMPGIDGYTVCQRIREFSSVPVILMSALSAPAAIERGLAVGADDFLTKPVGIDKLLSKMSALLPRSASRTQTVKSTLIESQTRLT